MLSLKPLFTVNRVTVFGDNADPDQFYYLPETVHLSTDQNGKPSFTLLKYLRDITDNPDFTEGQSLGGGFLIFSVDLSLDDDTRNQIIRQARRYGSEEPRLASAPFREGAVRVVTLDADATPVAGHVRFVEKVMGTATPSLFGDLQATFSLQLSQEGVVLLEQAFEKGGQPIGVIYDLKFLGLRPAFDITVKADYKRIYDDFSAGIAAQYMMFRAEIEAEFQKLVENKVIEVIVNSFTDDAAARQEKDQALKFLEDLLLKDLFSPSLPMPPQQTASILSSLPPIPGAPQTAGRTLSQVNSGTAPGQGPRTPTAQPANAAAGNAPFGVSGLAGTTALAAIRSLGGNNPSRVAAQRGSGAPGGGAASGTAGAPGGSAAGGGSTATATGSSPGGRSGPGTGAATAPATAPVRTPSPSPAPVPARSASPPPTSSAAGNTSNNFSVGFKLKYLHGEDLKTINMSWKEASAVEQTHSPNGTFGLLLKGLNKSEHFIAVDLDSDFFQRLKVMVDCPTPFASIGLSECKVHLEYGDRGDGQPRYVDDVELKPDAQGHVTPQEFTCSLDDKHRLGYRYRIDFYFDPSSNIRGQKMHYTTDMIISTDRILTIDPLTYVGFLRVMAAAGEINFDEIPRVQVKMGYDDDANNFHVQDTFILTKDKPSFEWLVRLNDPQLNQYWYELTYFLKDDQSITLPRISSGNRNIAINEPWQERLRLLLDAVLNRNISRLIVELEYEDPGAGYRVSFVKEIASDADKPTSIKIPVMDRNKQTYRYQVTAVGTDNSVRRAPYAEGTSSYLLVTPPA